MLTSAAKRMGLNAHGLDAMCQQEASVQVETRLLAWGGHASQVDYSRKANILTAFGFLLFVYNASRMHIR